MFLKLTTVAINCYLTFMITLVSIIGDYFVFRSKHTDFSRAFMDNLTHTLVGAISWMMVLVNCKDLASSTSSTIVQVILCAVIASFIDLDHFISARSFNLKDATSLNKRPFLHCTTIPILLTVLLLTLSYLLRSERLRVIALILFIAFISHHTRDATRRGYWLHPFGSTQPIPYSLYILITCLLPYCICWFHKLLFRYVEYEPLHQVLIA